MSRRTALPVFHALTGCDQTSFLANIGKKSAYDKWTNHPEVTRTLCNLGEAPDTLALDDIKVIEAFIVNLYSSICPFIEVDKARQFIFAQTSRGFDALPPTKTALIEHIKRVVLQAGYIWGQSLVVIQEQPIPSDWVVSDNGWMPHWTYIPKAAIAMKNDIKSCACGIKCEGMCGCFSKGFYCSALCMCGGKCYDRMKPPKGSPSGSPPVKFWLLNMTI